MARWQNRQNQTKRSKPKSGTWKPNIEQKKKDPAQILYEAKMRRERIK